jgi:Ca2+-transporting ATPase
LSKEQLKKTVEEYNVFARMSPEFKLKIVSALQENGRRVAITGDGVNDVPALKQAEVGISMGKKGSDIAKEAADIILLDDDLSSIVKGIKEGRTIFSNIRKVINYLLTSNLAEVFVVFLGSLIGVMPILALQLLWVNFVTDIAPAMALGIDPSHKDIMKKRPTGKNEKLINKRIALLTVFVGLKKMVLMFLLFLFIYKATNSLVVAQTASFTWLVFSHFVRVATIRFDEKVSFFVNKYLTWAVIVPVLLQVIIIYTPLSSFFHVAPLGVFEWAVLGVFVLAGVALAKLITTIIDKHLPKTELDY